MYSIPIGKMGICFPENFVCCGNSFQLVLIAGAGVIYIQIHFFDSGNQ